MPRYGVALATAPTIEPVTLDEAKKQVEVAASIGAHDVHLNRLIKTARFAVERDTGRALITQTRDLYLDQWPCGLDPIYLPGAPLIAISAITYLDTDGATQTLSSSVYRASIYREPGVVMLAHQQSWPAVRYVIDTIKVRYTCGYGSTAATVPEPLKHAMLLLIGHWFENREGVNVGNIITEFPLAYRSLVQMYQVGEEFTCYDRGAA